MQPPNVGWKTAKEAIASFNEISYKSCAFLHLFLSRNSQSLMFSHGCDVCPHASHLYPGLDKVLPSWLLYLAAL
jgi:hypothetical protein